MIDKQDSHLVVFSNIVEIQISDSLQCSATLIENQRFFFLNRVNREKAKGRRKRRPGELSPSLRELNILLKYSALSRRAYLK